MVGAIEQVLSALNASRVRYLVEVDLFVSEPLDFEAAYARSADIQALQALSEDEE